MSGSEATLLAVDVGNSTTAIGVFDGEVLVEQWRVSTDGGRTGDEWALILKGLMALHGVSFSEGIEDVVISSVVPGVSRRLVEMTAKYFHHPPVVVRPGTKTGIAINTDNPREVGADRLVNAVAAHHLYGGPGVVVNFGTSTTIDLYTAEAAFLGGVIAPGVEMSLDALTSRGAQLAQFELRRPRSPIARNTVEALQAGAVFGFAGQVDRIVEMVLETVEPLGAPAPVVVATGEVPPVILDECRSIDHHRPWLTLHGLRQIFDLNR